MGTLAFTLRVEISGKICYSAIHIPAAPKCVTHQELCTAIVETFLLLSHQLAPGHHHSWTWSTFSSVSYLCVTSAEVTVFISPRNPSSSEAGADLLRELLPNHLQGVFDLLVLGICCFTSSLSSFVTSCDPALPQPSQQMILPLPQPNSSAPLYQHFLG